MSMDLEPVIAACERLHGVAITVHDCDGHFPHRLPERRLRHNHSLCRSVKATGHERECIAFDWERIHDECRLRPDGFVKVCHAGLVELVVPWISDGVVCWLLQVGPWAETAVDAVRQGRTGIRISRAPPLPVNWPDLLDALRSLATRLAVMAPQPLPAAVTRREAIAEFLRRRHGEDVGLDDLAAVLGLSPSRTSHAVGELFGEPFARLLVRNRLESADLLLRCTDLPVATVADRAGFGDLSHFHAVFRRRHGCTPAVWRRRGVSA